MNAESQEHREQSNDGEDGESYFHRSVLRNLEKLMMAASPSHKTEEPKATAIGNSMPVCRPRLTARNRSIGFSASQSIGEGCAAEPSCVPGVASPPVSKVECISAAALT